MISVLLDGNVYDALAVRSDVRSAICALVEAQFIKVVVSRTVLDELRESPFGRVPDFFPVEYVGNTVGDVDMTVDDSIGDGEVFDAHCGTSKNLSDAYIADAASFYADWLVSEDKRLRKRMNTIRTRCQVMDFSEFVRRLSETFGDMREVGRIGLILGDA